MTKLRKYLENTSQHLFEFTYYNRKKFYKKILVTDESFAVFLFDENFKLMNEPREHSIEKFERTSTKNKEYILPSLKNYTLFNRYRIDSISAIKHFKKFNQIWESTTKVWLAKIEEEEKKNPGKKRKLFGIF